MVIVEVFDILDKCLNLKPNKEERGFIEKESDKIRIDKIHLKADDRGVGSEMSSPENPAVTSLTQGGEFFNINYTNFTKRGATKQNFPQDDKDFIQTLLCARMSMCFFFAI